MAPHADDRSGGTSSAAAGSRFHAASTDAAISAENEYAAHNYHPSLAVNQGHCHPELVKALCDQAGRLTLSSRAFYNDVFPKWAELVKDTFGYDMVLPMNTGAEAVETAIKIARKWAYKMTAISLSNDPESRDNYGPYVPNISCTIPATGKTIRYNSVDDIEEALESHGKDTAAFIIEPIQGEAGVVVPDEDYLARVHELCKKNNVLLICDEIQTGIARTGKAIAGGMYPVSAVLSRKEIMLVVEPGTHGSTFGGNPLGAAVSIRALELVKEENMAARADKLGRLFRETITALNSPIVQTVRGKGLLNAVVIDESKANGRTAWDLCISLKNRGILAKPTHGNIIRFAPRW
ncbi:unnamed protein product [Parascedosporium putredinis]|uniref:Ornithine aminotransferase n=1 Tax=Parascedosporium putredinis TaxID=1442378 RepID=A0A9P1HBC6_9PEZI|nr:unnamed protein product [Parascedosporium putredinis]CAI8003099.1 unnamed protein product [Parascedosporium putredinis]